METPDDLCARPVSAAAEVSDCWEASSCGRVDGGLKCDQLDSRLLPSAAVCARW